MPTTTINNITEPVTKLGSDLVAGDSVDLAGKHFVGVTDGGITRLHDVDSHVISDVVPGAAYTVTNTVITISP